MSKRSLMTMILLEGGLALSAIATFLGAVGLVAGIVVLAMSIVGYLDNYFGIMGLSAIGLGLVLLIPGAVVLRVCIRRSRAMRKEQ